MTNYLGTTVTIENCRLRHPRDPVRVLRLPQFHFLLFERFRFLWVTGNAGQICCSSIFIVSVCPRDWNKTRPAMQCLSTVSPSTVLVGTEMSGRWYRFWSAYQTRPLWRWKIPSLDGPHYTGLLTTARYTCRSFSKFIILSKITQKQPLI